MYNKSILLFPFFIQYPQYKCRSFGKILGDRENYIIAKIIGYMVFY